MKETYRCWAEIDRAALRHNAKVVRDRIGSAEMLAVVKANAYGHGLVAVAETLADEAQLFGVANLQEALTLRESLPHPIVILGPANPEERPVIAEHGFIPTISSLEEAQAFDRLKPVSVNFKIDTGMGRMGVVQNEAREVFQRAARMANIEIHSISTHMPVSNEDPEYTRDQLVRFQKMVEQIRSENPGNYKAHVLQSAGTLAFNQPTHEIVRAGIVSVSRGQLEAAQALGLRPGLILARIAMPQALRVIIPPLTSQYLNLTKNSSLAVAIGYQDIVSIANTMLNQTGQAIEGIALIMLVFLTISLSISLLMNWYNARTALVGR